MEVVTDTIYCLCVVAWSTPLSIYLLSVKYVCLFQQHLKKPVSGYTFQF